MHSLNRKLLHMRINALGNFDFNPLITTNATLAGYRIDIDVNKDSRTAVPYGGDER